METTYVYLDVETIPDQREGAAEAAAARVQAPSNYKDPEKIRAYNAEKGIEAHAKTSLDGAFGQLFAIGWKVGTMSAANVARQSLTNPTDEAETLQAFYQLLNADLMAWGAPYGDGGEWRVAFVGHNVIKFDLRFLWQRSVVNGVKPTVRLPYDASPHSLTAIDLQVLWSGDGREYISFDVLCQALGVESPKTKHAMTGADVWPRVAAGDWKSVIDYNLSDVEALAEAHQKFLALR